jgi:hypothetical protein
MVIGDKVRMLHGSGEGVVTKISGDQVTVMLTQGIEIPVHRRDLVVVAARQEAAQIQKAGDKGKPMLQPRTPGMLFLKEGIYLAGIPRSPMLVDFSIVNQSDYELFILIYKLSRPVNQFFTSIQLNPKSRIEIPGALPIQETNHLIGLSFQILKFHPSQGNSEPCIEPRLAFSQIPWQKTKQRIPMMETEGYLIQLDDQPTALDPEMLKQQMMSPKSVQSVPTSTRRIAFREIDLHIEKLVENSGDLAAAEILTIQIRQFEKAFDKAILDGVEKLIVIHGTGNGILRTEVQKRLSGNSLIKHFKDAQKERFGYGATEIQF